MQQKRRGTPRETNWSYFPELTIGNRTLWPGDPVKLKGTRSKMYHFRSLLTNTDTGKQWAVLKGPVTMHGDGVERVVEIDRIVIPPRRRKRVKQ